jgi:hypothetical protein
MSPNVTTARALPFAALFALLAGCASPPATEESSTRYDHIDCAALVAQRDALRAHYAALPPDPGERMAWGGFAGVRDAFEAGSSDTKARVDKGRINAMNDSLARRECPGAQERIE